MVPEGERTPREVLEELNTTMDDLVSKMEVWEGRLKRIMEQGSSEALVEEAGKGGYFGRKVTEVRTTLDENRAVREVEDHADRKEIDDLDAEIETKCDHVSKKIDALLDEIMDMEDDLGENIKRAMDQISDLDIYFDPED